MSLEKTSKEDLEPGRGQDPVTSSKVSPFLSPQVSCLHPPYLGTTVTHFPCISVGPSRWAFGRRIGVLKGKIMKMGFHSAFVILPDPQSSDGWFIIWWHELELLLSCWRWGWGTQPLEVSEAFHQDTVEG